MRWLGQLAALSLVLMTLPGCFVGGGGGQKEQVLRVGVELEQSDLFGELLGGPWPKWEWNLFDPLVKLDDELRPVPGMAERWELSEDGRTLTFHLRRDGRWTNGDPLTASDYAYGWKHYLATASDATGLFPGVVGVEAFARCDQKTSDCEPLWRKVGIKARDAYTLEVRFTSPQPHFVSRVAGAQCPCYLALDRTSVERSGDAWSEPDHVLTSGPFKVEAWMPEESLTLAKDENWRGADEVELDRVEISFYRTEKEERRTFEAGELDLYMALDEQPSDVVDVPVIGTGFVGFDVRRIPDPRQRRAMALAIDRAEFNERAYGGHGRPATSLTSDQVRGFERIASHFLAPGSRLAEAKRLLAQVDDPVTEITLWITEEGRVRGAVVKEGWEKLGLDVAVTVVAWKQYRQRLQRAELPVYLSSWGSDFPDASAFLELWRCGHPDNSAHFCDPAYDQLLGRALAERDEDARLDLYAQAEAMLTGPAGAMPVIPLHWYAVTVAAQPSVEDTGVLPMTHVDLTKVRFGKRPPSSTETTPP